MERLASPVSDQIDVGIAFVARFMQAPPGQRLGSDDGAPYDLDIIDEAIVSAAAHRDYAKIRLFLFADRLELHSPGKLSSTLTLDDMPHRTFTRNQLLVGFLSGSRSETHWAGVPGVEGGERACGRSSRPARRTRPDGRNTP